jgi:hypothetical protein
MNIFQASRLQDILDELRAIACSAEQLTETYRGSRDTSDSKFTKRAWIAVCDALEVGKRHDFTDAMQTAFRATGELSYSREFATIQSEVTHVADTLCDELRKRSFLLVTAARRGYIENPSFMGTDVSDAFPSALKDIHEAGNCLGAECNTAAVFHLMRVVEWGLRALCAHVGLRKAKRKKGNRVPISYADWETMLNQLQPLVDAKIGKMKRGSSKQAAQEFYYPALQDIRAIRDAWRNHLMHTRATYSSADADTICGHVRRLMSTLATKVREQ